MNKSMKNIKSMTNQNTTRFSHSFGIHHIADNILQGVGISIALSLAAMLVYGFMEQVYTKYAFTELMQLGIVFFPFFFLFVSFFMVFCFDMGVYTAYFSIYISMGMTRKKATVMISAIEAVMLIVPILASALIWNTQSHEIAETGRQIFPYIVLMIVIGAFFIDIISAFAAKTVIFSIILGGIMGLAISFGAGFIVGFDAVNEVIGLFKVIGNINAMVIYIFCLTLFGFKTWLQYLVVSKMQVDM